jgi:hypothetical protein
MKDRREEHLRHEVDGLVHILARLRADGHLANDPIVVTALRLLGDKNNELESVLRSSGSSRYTRG